MVALVWHNVLIVGATLAVAHIGWEQAPPLRKAANMICPLCGYEYDEKNLSCHSSCPMANGCAILCCPNCGYQIVDESKSSVASWLRKLLNKNDPKVVNIQDIEVGKHQ